MKYVVIGFGVAAVGAMEAIRSVDKTGEITLISDDPHGYYSRPGLAYYLTGELHDKALFPKTTEDLQRLNFKALRGHVTKISRENQTVEIEGAAPLSYDQLLIATGAQAIHMKVPGADLEGVLKLDHMEDAKRILKHARRGKTAVVAGGGITALELVEGLIARGMKVHYLLRGDRYWSNVLDEHESKIVERKLQEEGVKLHHQSELMEVIGKNGVVIGIRLQDDKILKCDMVAYAIGIRPRI